jgi:hypothetical protein
MSGAVAISRPQPTRRRTLTAPAPPVSPSPSLALTELKKQPSEPASEGLLQAPQEQGPNPEREWAIRQLGTLHLASMSLDELIRAGTRQVQRREPEKAMPLTSRELSAVMTLEVQRVLKEAAQQNSTTNLRCAATALRLRRVKVLSLSPIKEHARQELAALRADSERDADCVLVDWDSTADRAVEAIGKLDAALGTDPAHSPLTSSR